jgi:hypothetical protein
MSRYHNVSLLKALYGLGRGPPEQIRCSYLIEAVMKVQVMITSMHTGCEVVLKLLYSMTLEPPHAPWIICC